MVLNPSIFSDTAQNYQNLVAGGNSNSYFSGLTAAPAQQSISGSPSSSSKGGINPSSLIKSPGNAINKFGETLGFGSGGTTANALTPQFSSGVLTGGADAASGVTGAFNGGSGVSSAFSAPVSNVGSLGTTTPLGNIAGAAGIGYLAGGYLGGKTGSYLGAAGGAAGSFFAGTTAGAGMAAALGIGAQAFNFIAPGVGILIGGLAGKLFGGKKPSDKTMAGGVNLSSTEIDPHYAQTQSSTGKKFSQQNADFRDKMQTGVSQFSKYLIANGATPITDKTVVLVNGSRDGLRYFFRDPSGKEADSAMVNAGQDPTNYASSLSKDIMKQYNIPPELQTKLDSMNTSDINNFNKNGIVVGGKYQEPTLGPMKTENSYAQFVTNYTKTRNNA